MPLLQAGAVPFRERGDEREFLLVTSHRGRWIFPKGIVEPGETPEETARKEVEEEAGVRGEILPGALGEYEDRKSQRALSVRMYLLRYDGDCPSWEEGSVRERRWCRFEDALDLLKKTELRELLRRAHERLRGR